MGSYLWNVELSSTHRKECKCFVSSRSIHADVQHADFEIYDLWMAMEGDVPGGELRILRDSYQEMEIIKKWGRWNSPLEGLTRRSYPRALLTLRFDNEAGMDIWEKYEGRQYELA